MSEKVPMNQFRPCPLREAVEMLSTVYGVPVNIDAHKSQRVGFSDASKGAWLEA